MTKPTTTTFGGFVVQLGDGGSPETFAAPCGFTSKAFNQTSNTQETSVPDCDDPDAPAYIERGVDTQSAEITGTGVMAQGAFDTWENWRASGLSKNCRIYPMGLSNGYYQGAFVLTQFNNAVQRGQKVNIDVQMQSDGQYTWNP